MDRVDGGGERVLLVDPTGDLERRFGDALLAAGFDARRVDSAGACLGLLEREDVDGVLSAHALPDLDGIRLLRSVRVSRPTLPFVLAPDDGSEALAGDAIAAGASGYVPRGSDPATTVTRLRDSLDREVPWSDAEGQKRYRHLVERSPAPINLFDETGESIWCNDAALDLLGLDGREELVGHSIFEFIHPEDHELARKEMRSVIESKTSVGPTRMRLEPRNDDDVRHVQVSTAVGSFLGGDIGQAVVVDVTALRETQEDLRAERRLIEETLDTLQDLFYVVDAEGGLVRWNAATTEVTGYDDAELDSMDLADLFAEDSRDLIRDSLARALETGRDTVEARLRTGHGHVRLYELRARRLSTGDRTGGPRVVGIARDVSERRERERQLKVLERWLRHNVRNEINVIQGTAESIRDGDAEDVGDAARRIEERAEHMVEQADRERELVDLLANPPEPFPIEITDVVERQVRGIRERYPAADLDVDIDRAGDVRVVAIPKVGDAIGELVENAIEHSDAERPSVRIEVRPDDRGRVRVRVLDDGPGIPAAEREVLLFERDVDQLHHGSGLGLLFVYWVVRVSGGEVEFGANEPRGSAVTLTFRAAAGEHPG